ncbi:hypothetical protein KPSA3_04400 [Pseudomonas syringae pv. actinidiae]|uniref:Uncharacterized protein n=1 Tax=Pseudomonas syringae pv. actinidiae TaxID=103796 RepID=A0AAN4Q6H3_PSESF|nr:hypothetical protein KPSA3_04400 [Pseudomonas syringae pv. actinidiae]
MRVHAHKRRNVIGSIPCREQKHPVKTVPAMAQLAFDKTAHFGAAVQTDCPLATSRGDPFACAQSSIGHQCFQPP